MNEFILDTGAHALENHFALITCIQVLQPRIAPVTVVFFFRIDAAGVI